MKRKVLFLIVFSVLALLVSGCATTKQYVPLPDQSQEISNPEMARIYVLRPTSFGGAISMDIKDGDTLIGRTGPKGFICWERDPGQVEIIGKAENKSTLPIEVKKGFVYYIQQNVQMGFLIARNKLKELSDDEGKKKLLKCKPPLIEERLKK